MKFTNIEEISAVLQQGKSVSTYLGHQGNWEWVSSLPLHLDRSIVSGQIYHRLRNQAVDQLMLRSRERLGAVSVEMSKTLRWISSQLRDQVVTITGYIADQSPRKNNLHHYLPFLHHLTPVLVGAEKITKKYHLEAYYLDIKRIKRGYYEATFMKMHADPQSLPDFELTEIYYNLLEKRIHKQPECYLWTHKRFKHASILQPDCEHQ
jgi:KDO2-lipid IV(A) lauroyltransferase